MKVKITNKELLLEGKDITSRCIGYTLSKRGASYATLELKLLCDEVEVKMDADVYMTKVPEGTNQEGGNRIG